VTAGALIASGCGSSGESSSSSPPSASELAPIHGAYHPTIDPADFTSKVDNRYFPLEPGSSTFEKGVAENGKTPQTDDSLVLDSTKVIDGVECTVVRDVVSENGKPVERTLDRYTQDKWGNVWYFGELAKEVKHGKFVKAHDSWEAGVDGAQPGIIMPADPQPGEQYRQEYYPGHAMDQAKVIGPGGPVTVPYGKFDQTLKTEETAPTIDPGAVEDKYYASGIGEAKSQVVKGAHELFELVSVKPKP
jgi:hypothetical protein